MKKHLSFWFVASTVIITFGSGAFAFAVGMSPERRKDLEQKLEILQSRDWECKITNREIISSNADGVEDLALPAVCSVIAKCKGIAQHNFGWAYSFGETLRAKRPNDCQNVVEGIKERLNNSNGIPFYGSAGIISPIKKRKGDLDKYGRKCAFGRSEKYKDLPPQVVYRQLPGQSDDMICLNSFHCDRNDVGPGRAFVACPLAQKDPVEIKGLKYSVCPQINDCIDNEIPLTLGYFADELAQMKRQAATTSQPAKSSHVSTPVLRGKQ